MDDSNLSLKQIVKLPNIIIRNAGYHASYTDLLEDDICSQYSVPEMTSIIKSLFKKFRNSKYVYRFSIEDTISITPSYEEKIGFIPKKISNKTEEAILGYLNNKYFVVKFYESLIDLSKKLTYREAVYLVGSFFNGNSEEKIADTLGISKTSLQPIKKSCLVKMIIQFKIMGD